MHRKVYLYNIVTASILGGFMLEIVTIREISKFQ
jgi:hypothetical protein